MQPDRSWGGVHQGGLQVCRPASTAELMHCLRQAHENNQGVLATGLHRSYGDSCLNQNGVILDMDDMDCIQSFDRNNGVLRAEAGLSIAELLQVVVPHGWFVPVTPGTKFVTLGGAVANDVHGKDHHRNGSFGHHVLALGLLRSTGERLRLSAEDNRDLFKATIGGLGLTGLIEWVEIQLIPIQSAYLQCQTDRFYRLDEFFELSEAASQSQYCVAWIDCVSRRASRGLVFRGDFEDQSSSLTLHKAGSRKSVPIALPFSPLNRLTVGAFNRAYFHWPRRRHSRVHYDAFFYPLDGIAHWNRIYGRRGFYQHQSVLPVDAANQGVKDLLAAATRSGQASFLSVLKQFGSKPSAGLLSFAQPGVTLALDFPNRGRKTLKLLDELERIVLSYDGAIYPAKDGRMGAKAFHQMFPQWQSFQQWIDPLFKSDFSNRVGLTDAG